MAGGLALLAGLGVWLAAGVAGDAHAAPVSLYWDADGATGGGWGGTGPWNLTDSTWRLGSTTGTLQAWNNDVNGNMAYLWSTAGTLTLGADVTVAYINPGNGYVINGDGGGLYKLTFDSTSKIGGDGGSYAVMMNGGLLTINAPVILAGAFYSQFRGDVTFNGVVSGTAGLMSYGGDPYRQTVILTNANTFSGGISMNNGGRVIIGHDQALGTGSVNMGGGILRAANGNRTISNPMGLGDVTIATDGTNNLTLAGGPGTGKFMERDATLNINNPLLIVDRPIFSFSSGNYGYGVQTFNKYGTGTVVLACSSSPYHGASSSVNINQGALIVNGGAYPATTLAVTTTVGSAQVACGSTANLHVGQNVPAFYSLIAYPANNYLCIVSIDDATHFSMISPFRDAYSGNVTAYDVGALGYNCNNIIVSNAATLGGTGTIVLATGKTNTVLAGGTIAPGSVTAGTEVGTLTFTNGTFNFSENANYAWQYKDGVGDLVKVYGKLILPAVATVSVSQVSGDLPAKPTLFSATTLAGATNDLSGWVLSTGYSVTIHGNDVLLLSPPRGMMLSVH